jgi:hypothetical protein
MTGRRETKRNAEVSVQSWHYGRLSINEISSSLLESGVIENVQGPVHATHRVWAGQQRCPLAYVFPPAAAIPYSVTHHPMRYSIVQLALNRRRALPRSQARAVTALATRRSLVQPLPIVALLSPVEDRNRSTGKPRASPAPSPSSRRRSPSHDGKLTKPLHPMPAQAH